MPEQPKDQGSQQQGGQQQDRQRQQQEQEQRDRQRQQQQDQPQQSDRQRGKTGGEGGTSAAKGAATSMQQREFARVNKETKALNAERQAALGGSQLPEQPPRRQGREDSRAARR